MELKIRKTFTTKKMSCLKYLLVLFNIFFMIYATCMIIIGICGQLNYTYYYLLDALTVDSNYWWIGGIYLACLSLFGFKALFKESALWLNWHGALMINSFCFQIITIIIMFNRIGYSKHYVSTLFMGLLTSHKYIGYDESIGPTLHWIQRTFECCGLNGPSDWRDNPFYPSTTPQPNALKLITPSSCCTKGSNYQNLTCGSYFNDGCGEQITELLSYSIMLLGIAALIISVIQLFGIIAAFMLARAIRRTDYMRAETSTLYDPPSHFGYTTLHNYIEY